MDEEDVEKALNRRSTFQRVGDALNPFNNFNNPRNDEGYTPVAEESPYAVKHGEAGELRGEIDKTSRRSGYGEFSSIATKAFWGINHRGFGNPIPGNKDQFGLTFFTRPRLNLSYDNIAQVRAMMKLGSNNPLSVPRAVRAWLDPVGARSTRGSSSATPLVDPLNPFISILTNNLISISGWPDPIVDTYTSNPGLRKEEWSMADGSYRILSTYELTATFKNIIGDPITMLFDAWCYYQSLVYEGKFIPRLESIINNRVDYQTRIYRLVLDSTRTRVEKIAACGAAFPTNTTMGAHFNYATDAPYNVDNDQISINFKCMGADYLDPISIKEFNEVNFIYNRDLRRMDDRMRFFKKLNRDEKLFFNYEGYPLINEKTHELEIWVPIGRYREVIEHI